MSEVLQPARAVSASAAAIIAAEILYFVFLFIVYFPFIYSFVYLFAAAIRDAGEILALVPAAIRLFVIFAAFLIAAAVF